MTLPFKQKYENYQKIRTCLPKDYERVNIKGYIDKITTITDYPFSELCIDNWKGMTLIR
jgi:hypothetical protein